MDLDSGDSDSHTAMVGHKRKLPGLFLNGDGSHATFDKRPKVYENGDHVPFTLEQGGYDHDSSRRSSKESRMRYINSAGLAFDVDSNNERTFNDKKLAPAQYDQTLEDHVVANRLKQLSTLDQARRPNEKRITIVDEKMKANQTLQFDDYESICEWLMKNGFSISDKAIQHSGLKARVKQCRGTKNSRQLAQILLKLVTPGDDYAEQAQTCLVEQYGKFRSKMSDIADGLTMHGNDSVTPVVEQNSISMSHSEGATSVLEKDNTFAFLGGKTVHLADVPNIALRNHVQKLSNSMPGRSLEEILLGEIKYGSGYAALATRSLGHWLRQSFKPVQRRPGNADIPQRSLDELAGMLSQPNAFLRPMHIGDVAAGNRQLLGATIRNIELWQSSSWSETLLWMAKDPKFDVEARKNLIEYMMRFYIGAEPAGGENKVYSGKEDPTAFEDVSVGDAPLEEGEINDFPSKPSTSPAIMSYEDAKEILLQQPHMFKRPMTKQDFIATSTSRRMELQAQAESLKEYWNCSWEHVALVMADPAQVGGNGEYTAVQSSISSYISRCYLGQNDTITDHTTGAPTTTAKVATVQPRESSLPLRQKYKSEDLSLDEIADFLASPGCFSQQITLEDVAASDQMQLFQHLRSLAAKHPKASIASLLVETVRGDRLAIDAGSFLYRWLKNYYAGGKGLKKRRASALRLFEQHNAAALPPIPAPGGKRWLYVGPFRVSTSESEVRGLLRGYNVDQLTIPKNSKGVLKRHAFVTMMSDSDAERAVHHLRETAVRGKMLKVRFAEAHPRPSRRDTEHLHRLYHEANGRETHARPANRVIAGITSLKEIGRRPRDGTASESDNNDNEGGVSVQGNLSMTSTDHESTAQAVTPESLPAANSKGELLLLRDLSNEEQNLQRRYFQITDLNATVRCPSCGDRGHMKDSCPSRSCSHCNAFDEHFSSGCPAFRKCSRCRQRGHETVQCHNTSVSGGGLGDPCDVCGKHGHVEEECTGLWRSLPLDESNLKKIPASVMTRSCYRCGSQQHWGDDCTRFIGVEHRRLHTAGASSIWSAEHAKKFIEAAEVAQSANITGTRSTQNYQLAMLDDMRD